eukprot:s6553_g2.t1
MRELPLSHTEDVANCNASLHRVLECMVRYSTGLVNSMGRNLKPVFQIKGIQSPGRKIPAKETGGEQIAGAATRKFGAEQQQSSIGLLTEFRSLLSHQRHSSVRSMPNLEASGRQSVCLYRMWWQNRWPQKDSRCHLHRA